jgi:hypothetical protein
MGVTEAVEATSFLGEIPNCGPSYILNIKSMSSRNQEEVEKEVDERGQMDQI